MLAGRRAAYTTRAWKAACCCALLALAAACGRYAGRPSVAAVSPLPNPAKAGAPLWWPKRSIAVDVAANLRRLLDEHDTDGDKRITVQDVVHEQGAAGRRFLLLSAAGQGFEIAGTYYLSNLLQELTLARSRLSARTGCRCSGRDSPLRAQSACDAACSIGQLDPALVFEAPVKRISRLIRQRYWDGLTRRIDEAGLAGILHDDKLPQGGRHYLYVPFQDERAYAYFQGIADRRADLKLSVVRLPREVTPGYVRGLGLRHGLLSLGLARGSDGKLHGLPFVVPGGRFNEMYGWDSYFEVLGLLVDDRVELARAMVDNFVYQVSHYGKILNANRTYYLTRSQPPFLAPMALAVFERLGASDPERQARAWLKRALLAAIAEYRNVWTRKPRLTELGLSRYHGAGLGPPPEVEPGHFDAIYRSHAAVRGLSVRDLARRYESGELRIPELDRFFVHDRCVRESGHDTTYRWQRDGDRCADFVTVDLNALLHRTELDIARALKDHFGGQIKGPKGLERSRDWYERARVRRSLMLRYLWDSERGLFFDYDTKQGGRHDYVSATTLYPLWAWHRDDPETRILSPQDSARLAARALEALEMPGGVAASARASRGALSDARPPRQWDFPYGWPPHQMLIWEGLRESGMQGLADRLIYRWLYTITRNAVDYNGTVPEKFDVLQRSHKVFAEYGNVGTEFAYITREGFGWMNASYQVGLSRLPAHLREHLDRLTPPEWLFR